MNCYAEASDSYAAFFAVNINFLLFFKPASSKTEVLK